MFTCYFDDSGPLAKQSPAFVVAGYVADVDQWHRFEHEWNEILASVPGKRFHMTDFAHSLGEFASFKGKAWDRKRLMERLVGMIRVRARFSFSCAVSPEDYWNVDDKYLLSEHLGNPYSFCSRHCLGRVRQWAKKYGHSESEIEYIFEQGTAGKGELMQVMERDGFPSPIFRGKECAQLQATDLLAWEQLKALRLARAGKLYTFRRSFAELQKIPNNWGIYPKDKLEEICTKGEFGLRK